MGTYVGVDWASKGWVAAELNENDKLEVGFYPTVWNLWYDYEDDDPEQILVDIPIGLPEKSRRECDKQAKAELEERRSCVFWTPVREAVYEDNIEVAKEVQIEEEGADYSISNQAWAIVPRIREVDTFLRRNGASAERVVRESHPEVCFRDLADGQLSGKLGDDGPEERKKVLDGFLEDDWEEQIRALTEPSYARQSGEDDVLDAIVLAVTAKCVADDEAKSLPKDRNFDEPPRDDEGLPMEIVYPDPVRTTHNRTET